LNKTKVSELRGVGRQMPVTMTAWLVASAGVIGLPLTGGFWSKWYLARGTLEAGEPLMLAVILVGSLLAVGYLVPPAVRAFYAAPEIAAEPLRGKRYEAPWPSLAALSLTATLSVLLFFAAEPVFAFLEGFAS
jgi:multicomponent Na+:H+ antiporter subunit D